jgi:hypothetical protein
MACRREVEEELEKLREARQVHGAGWQDRWTVGGIPSVT